MNIGGNFDTIAAEVWREEGRSWQLDGVETKNHTFDAIIVASKIMKKVHSCERHVDRSNRNGENMFRVTKKIFMILEPGQRKMAVVLLFLMTIGAFLESIGVSLVLPFVTAIVNSQDWNSTWYSQMICRTFHINSQRGYIQVLLLLLIGIFIIKDIYILGEYYVQYTFIAKGRLRMQEKLMEDYIRKPYTFFLNAQSGEIIRIITGDTEQAFFLLSCVLSFYTEGIISLFLGVTVFVMSPSMAVGLSLILFLEIIIIAKIIKPIMKHQGIKRRKFIAAANKWVLQSINGIKSIKVSQTEMFFSRMYSSCARYVVDADRKQQTLNNAPRLLIETVTFSVVLTMVYAQVAMGTELSNIISQLSAFAIAAMRLLPSINRISSSINQIPFLEGSLDNIVRVMETEGNTARQRKAHSQLREEQGDLGADFKHRQDNMTFRESLTMSNITFSYPGTDKKILEHASMEIFPGQSIGIVGISGAGKTTTVDILLGLLKPQQGCIKIDGKDVEEDIGSWLCKIAYIPQKIFLMDSSIRENVAFGEEIGEIDDAKVWEALREAQMEEFVDSLPGKLDSEIGEQGIRLSGGQGQRIGIARALYRDPSILFFDEATSALDNETEAAIMESIENLKGKRTIVIIAHRLSTIENCDIVYRIDEGMILKERYNERLL